MAENSRNNGNNQSTSKRSHELKYRAQASISAHQELRDVSVVRFNSPMDHITEFNFVYRTCELTFVRIWSNSKNRWLFESVSFYSTASGHNPSRRQELHKLTSLPREGFIREAYELTEPAPARTEKPRSFELKPAGQGRMTTVTVVSGPYESIR